MRPAGPGRRRRRPAAQPAAGVSYVHGFNHFSYVIAIIISCISINIVIMIIIIIIIIIIIDIRRRPPAAGRSPAARRGGSPGHRISVETQSACV